MYEGGCLCGILCTMQADSPLVANLAGRKIAYSLATRIDVIVG